MDRSIPDVWNIFALSGSNYGQASNNSHGRVASHNLMKDGFHVNWSSYDQGMLQQWCDRSSVCERPRTYDKFYRKGPSNFQGEIGEKQQNQHDMHDMQQNHAANGCSSEEDIPKVSTGGGSQRSRRKKKRKGSAKLQYSRTITEKDVRSIERHLSLKKTIRKKVMRDLQQAFVEGDPNQISVPIETIPPEKLNEINLKRLNIGPKQNSKSDPKFLDLLRGDESNNPNAYSDDSGHCSGPSPTLQLNHNRAIHGNATKGPINPNAPKQPIKKYNFISDSGGSSCGGDESLENVVCDGEGDENIIILSAEQIQACVIDGRMIHPAEYHNTNIDSKMKVKTKIIMPNKNSNYMNSYLEGKTIFSANEKNTQERNYVNIETPKINENNEALNKNKSSNGKKTLWQKLTGGGNCSGKNRDSSKRVIK